MSVISIDIQPSNNCNSESLDVRRLAEYCQHRLYSVLYACILLYELVLCKGTEYITGNIRQITSQWETPIALLCFAFGTRKPHSTYCRIVRFEFGHYHKLKVVMILHNPGQHLH